MPLISYDLKWLLMVSLTVSDICGMLHSLGVAFISCLIFTTTDVMIDDDVEVSGPLRVTEVAAA